MMNVSGWSWEVEEVPLGPASRTLGASCSSHSALLWTLPLPPLWVLTPGLLFPPWAIEPQGTGSGRLWGCGGGLESHPFFNI